MPVPDVSSSNRGDNVDRRIVLTELATACATVVTALLATITLSIHGWWPVPVVALGWGLLTAVSDRSRRGLYLLFTGGALAMVAIVWVTTTDAVTMAVVPLLLYGIGIGHAANRLLFGVVYPVPDVRRRRQQSS